MPLTGIFAASTLIALERQVVRLKAVAAGLTFRSVADTIREDTEAWLRTRPADYAWRAGLTTAREQELLRAWRALGR